VSGGNFTAHLDPDTILTLSTSTGQQKGSYGDVSPSKPFPIPYKDDFESKMDMGRSAFHCFSVSVDRIC